MRGADYSPYVALAAQIAGWEAPLPEYRFHPHRRWRVDFAWPSERVALEIEGGAWVYGRHNRPSGYLNDLEKYNALAVFGWRLLRLTPQQVMDVQPLIDLLRAMREEKR
ncbi:MAG: hypothetical protein RML84_09135 [Anaerolineae bacterium]|nr:hypothetical protein [Anaerolineae bacterium]